MNAPVIKPVINRETLREFIKLPRLLHKDHKNWVPPVYRDEWSYHNRKRNRAFLYCDTIRLLAYADGKPVGRIMGVINHRHNVAKNTRTARFCLFECINNQIIAGYIFRYLEEWALGKGMTEIIGPFGMYYHDPIGYLVDGFEHAPAVATYYNFEYIDILIRNEGYATDNELVVYKIKIPDTVPAIYERILSRVSGNSVIKLAGIRRRKDLKPYILPVLQLMNETYSDIYGYSELDREEMALLAKQYMLFLDPDLVKIAEYHGEVIGFLLAMPNISKGLINSGGHLFPCGIFRIMRAARRSRQLDLLLGAIKKKFQGTGVDVLMGMDMFETARRKGFAFMDSHLEMETNLKVRAEMEKVGGYRYKKYRIYKKSLRKI